MHLNFTVERKVLSCEMDSAILLFQESMSSFDIACQEIALARMQNSILTESADFLYEDALDAMDKTNQGVVKRIASAITNFIKTVGNKMRGFISKKRIDTNIKEIQDAIKETPKLAQEKIEVIDLKSLTDNQKKYYNRVKAIISKQQSGEPLNKSELKRLNEWMNDETGKIKAKKIVIPISAAIAAVGATLAYCKASNTSLNELGGIVTNKIKKVSNDAKTAAKNMRGNSSANEVLKDLETPLQNMSKGYEENISGIAENIHSIKTKMPKNSEKSSTAKISMDYEVINKGIAEKDVALLRDAIGNLCYTSRNFASSEFDEAIKFVLSKGIKLKDEALVGELVSAGKTTFTKEDFTRAVFELKKNFCDERIADVKKIGKAVYSKPASAS